VTGRYYSPETRARVVRLARLQVEGDDRSKTQRFRDVAKQFGMTGESVRNWVRQAEIDEGLRDGLPTAVQEEIAELRARNAELESTVEILKAAAAFFARECDPQPPISADSSAKSTNGSESHRSAGR
jgi:transposase